MKKLIIIGAGPRGLAVALRAVQYPDIDVKIIDPFPLSTWSSPNMIPNMEMRSPISFDLVTFQRDLYSLYSLARYMKIFVEQPLTQSEVEADTKYCSRKEFIAYLKYIVNVIEKAGGVIIRRKVTDLFENKVSLEGGFDLEFDNAVVAIGKANQSIVVPNYLRNIPNLKFVSDLSQSAWYGREVNIVGSGQFAAELVEYVTAQGGTVNWITKYDIKVAQYPMPSWKEWGLKSALGDFYSRGLMNPKQYLKEVKAWQPTITPHVANLLEGRKYTMIQPSSTLELNLEIPTFLAAGSREDANLLPTTLDIKRDPTATNLPAISKDFKSESHPHIYFTGNLAARYDGPRQGSIISSGPTARRILDDVQKH